MTQGAAPVADSGADRSARRIAALVAAGTVVFGFGLFLLSAGFSWLLDLPTRSHMAVADELLLEYEATGGPLDVPFTAMRTCDGTLLDLALADGIKAADFRSRVESHLRTLGFERQIAFYEDRDFGGLEFFRERSDSLDADLIVLEWPLDDTSDVDMRFTTMDTDGVRCPGDDAPPLPALGS